jgi:hypothetical protein
MTNNQSATPQTAPVGVMKPDAPVEKTEQKPAAAPIKA